MHINEVGAAHPADSREMDAVQPSAQAVQSQLRRPELLQNVVLHHHGMAQVYLLGSEGLSRFSIHKFAVASDVPRGPGARPGVTPRD